MLEGAKILLAARLEGKLPPARATVMLGTIPASKVTVPKLMVSTAPVPLPSFNNESAVEKPKAVALKLPV